MVSLTRKQRELREREDKILSVAREQLCRAGYLGLNMDRIADQIEYSKGTVYQHFRNKEEILLALANDALTKRVELFRRAAGTEGRSRVRMAAIGAAAEAFVEKFPHHFMVEQIVRASSIWEKTSAERRDLMQLCERNCMQVVGGIVRDAVAQGDLTLQSPCAAEDLVFGLWSMNWGAMTIIHTSMSLHEVGIANPFGALRSNQNALLDGHGWRPFSHEFDFNSHIDRTKAWFLGENDLESP